MVTLDSQIHIVDPGGPHPPFLIRLLNLADRLLEIFPEVDTTGYFARVRENIIVERKET
jgi:hypothetical protein